MKFITLMPFRNEEHFLKTSIPSVFEISDEIICINDKSDDSSGDIALKLGATVYENTKNNEFGSIENEVRNSLLNLGRDHKGTHFLFLDADEAISSNFKDNFSIIKSLNKGESLELMWLAMWKSVYKYKDDNSVWSSNYKDFIYRDDEKHTFKNKTFKNKNYKKYDIAWPTHPERTPAKKKVRVKMEHGAVLHYQFSNWEAFQLKQCWYRCSELIQSDGQNHDIINNKYKITLENNNALYKIKNLYSTKKLPIDFYKDINIPDLDEVYFQSSWRLSQIKEWFLEFGKDYFLKLDIWHLDSINNL
jgi:glycosyltransferase involved in cell wall biosynthesis